MAEVPFDVEKAWEQLRELANKMTTCSDADVYDAIKVSFDPLVAQLKTSQAIVPDWVLANGLLRTQFVPKANANPLMSDAQPAEAMLFGMKAKSANNSDLLVPEAEIPTDQEPVEKPTAEQIANADRLIREARVFQMRGNRDEAMRLLKEAEAAAPNASLVLEAVGDELLEARKFGEARRYYDRARIADPLNLSADKKFADSVFRTNAAVHQYDPSLDAEIMANPKSAAILSFILPGLGQIVRGSTIKGLIFMLGYLACAGVALKMGLPAALVGLGTPNAPKSEVNPMVWGVTSVGFLIYIANAIDVALSAKISGKKQFDRPRPPENLPFE